MTRRYSSKELTFLRNRVPISRVIDTLLELPTRGSEGKLSFACPVCGGFDTSINAAHNLARCFACRKNYNPIRITWTDRIIKHMGQLVYSLSSGDASYATHFRRKKISRFNSAGS